jgi:hypothetical protein
MMQTTALKYASMGFPVFPCKVGEKTPATVHGFKDASTTPATIKKAWGANQYNIGLNTGAVIGNNFLVVLDIDPRNGGDDTLASLTNIHGALPDTAMVLTGGGGQHYYFLCPVGIELAGKMGNGIDLKSQGGYVIAPPSIHPNGNSYEWEASSDLLEGHYIANLPVWIIKGYSKQFKVLTSDYTSYSIPLLTIAPEQVVELRSALLHLRADDRDMWVNMGHALKELGEVGRGLWLEWSSTSDKFNAKDDAQKWESFAPINKHFQSVFYEAQKAGWVNPQSKIEKPLQVKSVNLAECLIAVNDGSYVDSEIPHIVEKWIPENEVTLLAGHGGKGKSYVALSLAIHVALGLPFGELATMQTNVLFFSGEDGNRVLRLRLSRLCNALKINRGALDGKLHLLDASDIDPALHREQRIRGGGATR